MDCQEYNASKRKEQHDDGTLFRWKEERSFSVVYPAFLASIPHFVL